MRRNSLLDVPDSDRTSRRAAGGLFFVTCASVFLVRWLRWEEGAAWDPASMWNAWWFTATLMAILLAHELAHYGVAKAHGFRLSLPWFLPAPFWVGTLGAVIRLEEPPRSRAGLLEMGAAGPLGGMMVVSLVMVIRMVVVPGEEGGIDLSSPLLWKGVGLGLNGTVLPVNTADPMGFAAWLGCLLTAMNLLPIGQLDGGHIASALSPQWAPAIGWATTACLLVAGFWWPGWAVWAAVVHLMGARHPLRVVKDEGVPKGRPILVAIAAGIVWCLAVVPVPF